MLLVLILKRVDSGFMEQYSALKTPALTFVKESLAKIKIDEIIVTGHSLGGAVAAMLGVLLSEEVPDVLTRVVTFGSPTPGDVNFQRLFNSRYAQ